MLGERPQSPLSTCKNNCKNADVYKVACWDYNEDVKTSGGQPFFSPLKPSVDNVWRGG